jgi:hypothetical protein
MDEFLAALAQVHRLGSRRSWTTTASNKVTALTASLATLRRRWFSPTRRALYPGTIAPASSDLDLAT